MNKKVGINIKIPKSLHYNLKIIAATSEIPLVTLIVMLLEKEVDEIGMKALDTKIKK